MIGDVDLQSVVNELSQIDGVRSGMIVTRDGAQLAHIVTGEDEDLLGALTGAMFATINRAMQRTGLGELSDVVISSTEGSLQAMAAGHLLLVVLGQQRSNMGLIRLEMRRAANRIVAANGSGDTTQR